MPMTHRSTTAVSSFCTYFDINYLDRGLCLWNSLKRYHKNANLFICCLDKKTFEVLRSLNIADVSFFHLENVERQYPALLQAKNGRTTVEYYFSITPSLIRYVLEENSWVDKITYIDSDLMFFSDPQPLFDELEAKSGDVGIIAHRFPAALQHLEIYGKYNVGWVTILRTDNGMTVLLDWQAKCIEWCFDRVEGDRFADQKYLDTWRVSHRGVAVLEHKGANVALWNVENGTFRKRGRRIEVYDQELIFYHFHGLSQIGSRTFFTSARMYGVVLEPIVRHNVYGHYISEIRATQARLRTKNVQALLRYKHSREDIAFARRHPFSGLFLYSIFRTAIP